MYPATYIGTCSQWRQHCFRACLVGIVCLALILVQTGFLAGSIVYASGPGGNVSDPVVRAVDIAEPAVVRIYTQVVGQLAVTFSSNQTVTFPFNAQNGATGYPLGLLGSGAFISAHGDLLTADHVVNPPKADLDSFLDQEAAPDVAAYINQHLKPAHPATQDAVQQELTGGQLQSSSQYQQPISTVYLDTAFTGPLSVANFQGVPASQKARVDQIKQQSPTEQKDTAIIHVSGMDNMPMLQLGNSSLVQQQDQLVVLGFPGNADVNASANDFLTVSINHVSVSALKTTQSGAPVIQVDGNVQHGDSGGPALNSNGQVVGVVSFGVTDNSGTTSFMQASSSAQALIQAAGINTTPSPLQQAWSKAFSDYAANTPGHWHQATRELQGITTQYPQFKAVGPYLQYASQQAQTETQTQSGGVPNGAPAASGGINPLFIVLGGVLVLLVLVGGVVVGARRNRAAVAVAASPAQGYGVAPNQANAPAQTYSPPPVNAPNGAYPQAGQNIHPPIPQTPRYPGQSAYPQPPHYNGAARPSASPSMPAPQPNYRPAQPFSQPAAGNMGAFGAPPAANGPQPASVDADATLMALPRTPDAQWRTWPCGHINRADARFCGTCGESSPPAPFVRRVEQ